MNQRSTARQRRLMRVVAFMVAMFVVVYLTLVNPDQIQPPIVALIVVLLGAALAAAPRPTTEKSNDEPSRPSRGNGPQSLDSARAMVEKALEALEQALRPDSDDERPLRRSVFRPRRVRPRQFAIQRARRPLSS